MKKKIIIKKSRSDLKRENTLRKSRQRKYVKRIEKVDVRQIKIVKKKGGYWKLERDNKSLQRT